MLFRSIRGSVKNGLAVVPVQRGASAGSFFTIPPQRQMDIAQRKKIIADEHSGRILVDLELALEEQDEKPKGTPKQVSLDQDSVERRAMEEVLNRVCTEADSHNENVMFMIDAISEDQRSKRLPNMYAHILGRAADRPEMRRAVEPPVHIDSELSASIQFADWEIGRASCRERV